YLVSNSDEFIGFICGIISQDHDLQYMYLDSFLQIACLKDGDVSTTISKLETISTKFHVDFVLSISVDESELPDNLKPSVIVSL
ncbi:MAG: twitching motility protein PilT, partial [Lachnospiraceae bacterium]|nr:twitching motility protein PilT [Lachnospiraceae bacterium]